MQFFWLLYPLCVFGEVQDRLEILIVIRYNFEVTLRRVDHLGDIPVEIGLIGVLEQNLVLLVEDANEHIQAFLFIQLHALFYNLELFEFILGLFSEGLTFYVLIQLDFMVIRLLMQLNHSICWKQSAILHYLGFTFPSANRTKNGALLVVYPILLKIMGNQSFCRIHYNLVVSPKKYY